MSGARLDLGQPERRSLELDIPELDPDRAFEWSPALFAARATVLEELGRDAEAEEWHQRAEVAADALDAASGMGDLETIRSESKSRSVDGDRPASDAEAASRRLMGLFAPATRVVARWTGSMSSSRTSTGWCTPAPAPSRTP